MGAIAHDFVLKNAFSLHSLPYLDIAVLDLIDQSCVARSLLSLGLSEVHGFAPRPIFSLLFSFQDGHFVFKCLCQLLKHLLVPFWVTLICQLGLLDPFLTEERVKLSLVNFLSDRVTPHVELSCDYLALASPWFLCIVLTLCSLLTGTRFS